MSGLEILQLIGCCLCAAYTITFVMMGWALGVEVWHDRKRELLFPVPAIRSIASVAVFFVAAVPFAYLCYVLLPL